MEKGNLIKIARQEGFKTFYIPGERKVSDFSPVGLPQPRFVVSI